MEVQSNPIPVQASSRYSQIWSDYSTSIRRGEFQSLASYCRETHTSYEGIRYWLRSRGLSVKSLKQSSNTGDPLSGISTSEAESPTFIQFAPSASAVASSTMHGISIAFPDGVNLSIREGSAEGVADLLAIYRSRCKAAGGL